MDQSESVMWMHSCLLGSSRPSNRNANNLTPHVLAKFQSIAARGTTSSHRPCCTRMFICLSSLWSFKGLMHAIVSARLNRVSKKYAQSL